MSELRLLGNTPREIEGPTLVSDLRGTAKQNAVTAGKDRHVCVAQLAEPGCKPEIRGRNPSHTFDNEIGSAAAWLCDMPSASKASEPFPRNLGNTRVTAKAKLGAGERPARRAF